jgi:hypothetical protein
VLRLAPASRRVVERRSDDGYEVGFGFE